LERQLTKLEKGIKVSISNDQLELLKNEKGFLSYENYPDEYKKIAEYGEVGRFMLFRFLM
jgi:hypothetical protein